MRKIIRQVAEALDDLHSRNIVHVDIKLENILMSDLTMDAKLRIADFGSAVKLNTSDQTSGFRIGTPGYMAPEIIQGMP